MYHPDSAGYWDVMILADFTGRHMAKNKLFNKNIIIIIRKFSIFRIKN